MMGMNEETEDGKSRGGMKEELEGEKGTEGNKRLRQTTERNAPEWRGE